MPRYYFNLFNDDTLRDETGEDLLDAEAARASALRGISELIAEHIASGQKVDLCHRIEIEDTDRRPVETIFFADLFSNLDLAARR